MHKRKLPPVLFIVIIIILITAANGYAKGQIRFGVIGPMKFNLGNEMWNGAVQAADEINGRGGVQVGDTKMQVKLIKVDSNEFLNITSPTNAIEMLFFRNKVDFVVGGFRSEAVLSMQDVAMDYKKIFISAGAASSELTRRVTQNYERYKYYFRGGTFNNYDLGKACFLQLNHVAETMKEELGVERLKVAIVAERTGWVDELIDAAEKNLPAMGLELAGIFRTSSVATDMRTEIKAVAKTQAPIVLTWFSSSVGATFVQQALDYELPAIMLGINGALQSNLRENSLEKADFVMTISSFAPDVEMSSKTKPFVENYIQRFGSLPGFTAGGTYTAIACTIVPAIEKVGTLNPDVIVDTIEKSKYETPNGMYAYTKDSLGRQNHEIKFGSDYVLPLAIQWQKGQVKAVWPKNYQENPGAKPLSYKGVVDMQIPQWIIKKYKKS